MILESPALEIFGIYDRGVPNSERIVLYANQTVDLVNYFIIIGLRGQLGVDKIIPIPDQFLWLGQNTIQASGWIFIFTGPGKQSITKEINTNEPLLNLYWNKPDVILGHNDLVPALVRADFVQIGNKPNKSISELNNQKNNQLVNLMELLKVKK
jgi:hypothetical protein